MNQAPAPARPVPPRGELRKLFAAGAVGTGAPGRPGPAADPAIRIERGELSRVDPGFGERLAAARDRR